MSGAGAGGHGVRTTLTVLTLIPLVPHRAGDVEFLRTLSLHLASKVSSLEQRDKVSIRILGSGTNIMARC